MSRRNLNEHHSQYKYRRRRKCSWSHDSDSGVSSTEGSISGSHSSITSLPPSSVASSTSPAQGPPSSTRSHHFDTLHLSPQLREITAIARKAGEWPWQFWEAEWKVHQPSWMFICLIYFVFVCIVYFKFMLL